MLALSYSHDPDGPKELYSGPWNKFDSTFTQNYDEYLRHSAFDLALQKPNITLRRDGAGGAGRQIERNALGERPAVVDAHGDAPAGARVGDVKAGAEGQRPVRRRQAVRVETLAVARAVGRVAAVVPAPTAATAGGGRRPRRRGQEARRNGLHHGGRDFRR